MKSGTTWLHQFLRCHPDCSLPPVKELHYFDLRHRPRSDKTWRANEEWWRGRIAHLAANDDKKAAEMIKISRLETPDDYVAYLSRFKNQAYGEITPSYARLPVAGFREIDALFPGSRFIFTMRDPVERLWSQVRSQTPRAIPSDKDQARETALPQSNMAFWPDVLSKSRYDKTIQTLESVVAPSRILYLFYEELFSRSSVEKIESFLGIKPCPEADPMLQKTINVSPSATMDCQTRKKARTILAPCYEFIERRFGKPTGWMY